MNLLSYRLLLLAIMVLGIFLRFVNVSPYLYYPDAYQNLLVSENIQKGGQVVGLLGQDGMLFPQFVMWARPLYPLFINLFSIIFDPRTGAQIISYLMGVFAIALSYFLVKEIYASEKYGLFAAFLTSLSGNHIIWSGFIMSDTTGIAFALLFLYFLFRSYKKTSQLLDMHDIGTGFFLACAFFARFEYFLLSFPMLLLIASTKSYKEKLITISVTFLFVSSLLFALLFPIIPTIYIVVDQLKDIVAAAFAGIAALSLFLFFKPKHTVPSVSLLLHFASFFFFALAVFSLILFSFDLTLPYVVGLSNFIKTDPLLSFLSFLGLGLLTKSQKHSKLSVFLLSYLFVLLLMYLRINPLQQRYNLHLLPVLLISASYGFFEAFRFSKKRNLQALFILFLLGSVGIQSYISFNGIRKWDNGDWFRTSYEEDSAVQLKNVIQKDDVLVVSMPEPYYFFTKNSTRSVSEKPPYLIIDDLEDEKNIVIVNDMGMRYIFPEFSKKVDENLKDYSIDRYTVEKTFRYVISFDKDEKETVAYRLTKRELTDLIK